ncbi:MAG TPA: trehalase family glycosidase, partial [Myxococcaceae bacterium]|nr:trehalase family glycosidase [Myxococcaceae bacterium]
MKRLLLILAVAGCAQRGAGPPATARAAPSDESRAQLIRLLQALDRDRDGRVTQRDARHGVALRFEAELEGRRVVVEGAERLSELAQLLAWSVVSGAPLYLPALEDGRAARMRRIARGAWDPLTRHADNLRDLVSALRSSRVTARHREVYVYFPESDPQARARLTAEHAAREDLSIVLIALPRQLTAEWYERLDRQPGLLYLPHAYVVPGGHFNEMYGWDSYFMARGAIADGRPDLARAMLENFVYQIEHYGKIGNSNRSYHRGRSQPPFLGALARSVSEAMPPGPERDAVIRRALRAGERELREIWLSPPRITPTGLSLYRDEWNGPLPETSGQHYKVWRGDDPEFRAHQRAVRESGWDMTLRFGERGHRTIPVCLNAL